LYISPQAAIQASKKGHHFIVVVKTSHARFPKRYLEEHLKDKSDGCMLVLTTNLEGVDLVAAPAGGAAPAAPERGALGSASAPTSTSTRWALVTM
jgi:hypothetical protein